MKVQNICRWDTNFLIIKFIKMKTISYELSKRLNDLGLLDDVETEYLFYEKWIYWNEYEVILKKYWTVLNPWKENIYPCIIWEMELKWYEKSYKTLTLEEAIEFLPEYAIINTNCYFLMKMKYSYSLYCLDTNKYFQDNNNKFIILRWSQIEQIEGMIEYLIDNNLLNK